MNILVTGSNGQLGSEIKLLKNKKKLYKFFFCDIDDLDITNFQHLENYLRSKSIDAIINCAAYTNVDEAENDHLKANLVNNISVKNMVKLCAKIKIKLIHISTDYVFDGNQNRPYVESDNVNPIGVYGKTKRDGEIQILNSKIESVIIRTSWLYSQFGNNFVKKILASSKSNKQLMVVNDQFGSPTHAKDLAETCLKILNDKNKWTDTNKIYHFCNDGFCSWFEFAEEIIKISKSNSIVKGVDSKFYKTVAERPKYSVMNNSKIKKEYKILIKNWKLALLDFFKVYNSI